jgi:hypothetical protein
VADWGGCIGNLIGVLEPSVIFRAERARAINTFPVRLDRFEKLALAF